MVTQAHIMAFVINACDFDIFLLFCSPSYLANLQNVSLCTSSYECGSYYPVCDVFLKDAQRNAMRMWFASQIFL